MAKLPIGSRLISGWKSYLNYERGLADNTVDAYCRDVRMFIEFLEQRRIDVDAVTANVVVDFSRTQAEAHMSLTTIGRRIASIRQFLEYLHEQGTLPVPVHQHMDQVKRADYLPRVLNEPQMRKLIRKSGQRRCDSRHAEAIALRNQAIVEFLYATGARVSEAAALTMRNINLDDGWVRLFGKGAKERRVRLGSFAIAAMKQWMKARTDLTRRLNEAVFITTRGNAMDRTAIWRIVEKNSRSAGLGKISPHTLRHSCATHMLINGCNLRTVQEILGHSDVTTTQKYLHLDISQLKKCHQKFHPRL